MNLWFILQFYQSYAAAKAREYLDKPALHETMVKVFKYFFHQLKLLYYMYHKD